MTGIPLRIPRKVGLYALDLYRDGDDWFAAVDGTLLRGRFKSEAEAREFGFAELKVVQPCEAPSDPTG